VISGASKAYREVLELNPAVLPAYQGPSILHPSRGELDQALALVEKAYAFPLSWPKRLDRGSADAHRSCHGSGTAGKLRSTPRSAGLIRKLNLPEA